MILVTASAQLRSGAQEDALAAARRMQSATAQEQGCLEYRFWTAIDDPDRILLFERWTDQAALDAHLAAPHTRDFGAAIASYADGPVDLNRFEVGEAGPLR